jgi:hypothetical protein
MYLLSIIPSQFRLGAGRLKVFTIIVVFYQYVRHWLSGPRYTHDCTSYFPSCIYIENTG